MDEGNIEGHSKFGCESNVKLNGFFMVPRKHDTEKFLKGGADEKNRAKRGADGTKMQTFRRILLGKSEKSNPKGGAAAPTASPLDPPLRSGNKTSTLNFSSS